MGILLALTVVCAVLARCGAFGTGETLEDLAKKQELAAAENPESAVSGEDTAQPDSSSLPGDGSAVSPQNQETQPEPSPGQTEDSLPDPPGNTTDQPERETGYPQEDIIMEDRVTYQEGFYYESLNDAIKEKITGISYPEDDSNAAVSYDMLRYVSVLYYDFNGASQTGELICHKAIAQDLVEIFCELYEAGYPIERICLVDEYQGCLLYT